MNIRNSESLISFKYKILKFIRPSENRAFPCNNSKGIRLLNRVRLGLSHLREHESKYNVQGTLNPTCSCGEDIVISCHYLLHCSLYNSILELGDSHIVEVPLHGRNFLDLNTTIKFLLETRRFDERLF